MLRPFRLLLCVALLAGGLVLSSASNASAVASCESGRFCVWQHNGFTTGSGCQSCWFGFFTYSRDYGAHVFRYTSTNVNDQASSWNNNGNTNYARMFKDTYYNGQFSGPKPTGSYVGDMVDGWNDTLSSACFISGSSGWCIG